MLVLGEYILSRSRPTIANNANDEKDEHVFPSVINTVHQMLAERYDSHCFAVNAVLITKFLRYPNCCSFDAFFLCGVKLDLHAAGGSLTKSFSSPMRHVHL